jgi:hypothetical protein
MKALELNFFFLSSFFQPTAKYCAFYISLSLGEEKASQVADISD